ncbi:type IV pilus biogenesis/stability protein PilW [Solimicrobium silvestre]|uniref:type IV pilus biogenesis/stability protein PilW n=1 Tax=Solimicrobium silvestre TaxID=2099400 RepID=UPI0013FD9186|nr:type IV pilus biogenesis/stability protein PilW [Solimicrobium silvestre]
MILSGILTACTTTYDAPKLGSPSVNDGQVQGSDAKRAAIRLQLGISYLQQDQFPVALKELNNAISIDPTLADAYGVRAVVYMQMQENNLAEQDFLRVMKLAPNNPDHTSNYAWFLCQNGKEKQAMDMFDRVIKDRTYTQPVKALNNAGLCSLKMKDDVLAESYFAQALRFDVNNATTNLNLAHLSYKKQDWTRGQFYVNRLIKVEAYTPEVLWLAIKIDHKLNDLISESSLVVQLRRRFPESDEYAKFQRGAFDE